MQALMLCFAAGALALSAVPALPSAAWLLLALLYPLLALRHRLKAGFKPLRAVCDPLKARSRPLRWAGAALLGVLWSLASGHWQLAHQLSPEQAGEDFVVRGTIVGLPDSDQRRQRVLLDVSAAESASGEPLSLRRVQVSWYGAEARLRSGERWQLKLRLRPPRGFVNPSAFDYQLWLMRQGVDAVGYVRAGAENQRLNRASPLSLSHWRQRAQQWLLNNPQLHNRGLLQALLVGDRSELEHSQWQRLQRTGTNHLMAISGLHVGFVALLGFGVGALVGRLVNLAFPSVPAPWLGHLLALSLALCYSALAGFALPTQRALVMVLAVQLYRLNRRTLQPGTALSLALAAVVGLDPLAGFDLGFWLSFIAVGVLLLAFVGRRPVAKRWPGQSLISAQWVVFLGLLVPLALLTDSATVLAPLANIVAIPLVTFAVVPWLLISVALAGLWVGLSQWLLTVADLALVALSYWLESLDRLGGQALEFNPNFTWPGVFMALLGALLLLLPRGLPGRILGLPTLLLALVAPGPRPPALRVTLLDVGQGLAVVVQTPNHSLVYDTGPSYSERMEAGGAIIAPYLRHRGISALDALVVSHGHDDHAGGTQGLLAAVPAARLWVGERRSAYGLPAESCHENQRWEWDGVQFELLHAGFPAGSRSNFKAQSRSNAQRNNRSCVLLVRHQDQHILLTGDIEREIEWRLLASPQLPESLALLQVPHHGSNSSSTAEWVQWLKPRRAVVSAGFQGRFKHPNAEVVERYREQGSRVLNTAELGALEFEWDRAGRLTERYYREHQKRYWYRDFEPESPAGKP